MGDVKRDKEMQEALKFFHDKVMEAIRYRITEENDTPMGDGMVEQKDTEEKVYNNDEPLEDRSPHYNKCFGLARDKWKFNQMVVFFRKAENKKELETIAVSFFLPDRSYNRADISSAMHAVEREKGWHV